MTSTWFRAGTIGAAVQVERRRSSESPRGRADRREAALDRSSGARLDSRPQREYVAVNGTSTRRGAGTETRRLVEVGAATTVNGPGSLRTERGPGRASERRPPGPASRLRRRAPAIEGSADRTDPVPSVR